MSFFPLFIDAGIPGALIDVISAPGLIRFISLTTNNYEERRFISFHFPNGTEGLYTRRSLAVLLLFI